MPPLPTRQPITAETDWFGRPHKLQVIGGKFFGTYSPWSGNFCPAWLLIPSERAEIEALLGMVSFECPPVVRVSPMTYPERLEAALDAVRAMNAKPVRAERARQSEAA